MSLAKIKQKVTKRFRVHSLTESHCNKWCQRMPTTNKIITILFCCFSAFGSLQRNKTRQKARLLGRFFLFEFMLLFLETRKMFVSFLLLSLLTLTANTIESCTPPPFQDLAVFPENYAVRYYSNIDLSSTTQQYPKADKAVIVIHGAARNADDYYCAMSTAAQIQGYNVLNGDIIIIAPRFMQATDDHNQGELYWPGSGNDNWRGGANSLGLRTQNEKKGSVPFQKKTKK